MILFLIYTVMEFFKIARLDFYGRGGGDSYGAFIKVHLDFGARGGDSRLDFYGRRGDISNANS